MLSAYFLRKGVVMAMDNKTVVRLDTGVHKMLRIAAAELGCSMKELSDLLIFEGLRQRRETLESRLAEFQESGPPSPKRAASEHRLL